MKKCIVCGKEFRTRNVCCNSCLTFLKWKYGSGYYNRIQAFKEFERKRFDFNSTKARRLKK